MSTVTPKFSSRKFAMSLLALLILILAACAPTAPVPQTGMEPTKPVDTAAPPAAETPSGVLSGLDAEDILLQLTYEPGFTLPEYRFRPSKPSGLPVGKPR